MSMMSSAVTNQSSSIGAGSAARMPFESGFEIAMRFAPFLERDSSKQCAIAYKTSPISLELKSFLFSAF
jgi:hypothetical protein